MAKSPAERLQELNVQVEILRDRDATRGREVADLERRLDGIREDLTAEREARHKAELELGDLRRQFQDHLAQYQEWDKRRWGLFGMLIGAVLALASGLTIALVKK